MHVEVADVALGQANRGWLGGLGSEGVRGGLETDFGVVEGDFFFCDVHVVGAVVLRHATLRALHRSLGTILISSIII